MVSEICSLLYVFQGHSGKRSGHLHPERERKKKKKGRKGRRSHLSNALPSHFPNCSLSQSKMRSIAACLHMSAKFRSVPTTPSPQPPQGSCRTDSSPRAPSASLRAGDPWRPVQWRGQMLVGLLIERDLPREGDGQREGLDLVPL